MLQKKEVNNFLAFLLTGQPDDVKSEFKASSSYPVDLSTNLTDKSIYEGDRDFFNVFRETELNGWALAGVGHPRVGREISVPGVKHGFSYEIQMNKKSVGYIGVGSKKVILNFSSF